MVLLNWVAPGILFLHVLVVECVDMDDVPVWPVMAAATAAVELSGGPGVGQLGLSSSSEVFGRFPSTGFHWDFTNRFHSQVVKCSMHGCDL